MLMHARHYSLVIGLVLLMIGIAFIIFWAFSFERTFSNSLINNAYVKARSSITASIPVNIGYQTLTVAIKADPPNTTALETIRQPDGLVVSSNNFSGEFFTMFIPQKIGTYKIDISNLAKVPITVSLFFDSLSDRQSENHTQYTVLGVSIAGSVLVILGLIFIVLGGVQIICKNAR